MRKKYVEPTIPNIVDHQCMNCGKPLRGTGTIVGRGVYQRNYFCKECWKILEEDGVEVLQVLEDLSGKRYVTNRNGELTRIKYGAAAFRLKEEKESKE